MKGKIKMKKLLTKGLIIGLFLLTCAGCTKTASLGMGKESKTPLTVVSQEKES
jgi:hypothetical protein